MSELRAFQAAGLKEWRTLTRYPFFLLAILSWPNVLPIAFVLQAYGFAGGDERALARFAQAAGTTELPTFVFSGMAMFVWITVTLFGPGLNLRQEQVRGSLEAQFLTPARRGILLFGPALPWTAVAFVNFLLMLAVLRVVFAVQLDLVALGASLIVIAATFPAMVGIGALFATVALRLGDVNSALQLLRALLVVCCGITYPLALLPDWARSLAMVLPPTQFVSDLRAVLLQGVGLVELAPGLVGLVLLGVFLSALAHQAFALAERHARRAGTLGLF
jgi:ABC-2 type transport system permease protein